MPTIVGVLGVVVGTIIDVVAGEATVPPGSGGAAVAALHAYAPRAAHKRVFKLLFITHYTPGVALAKGRQAPRVL